ncbi:MAG: hypothetical protein KC645_06560 [Gemmatimonadetes bacterium]|nr:hypothetical protein [Gemmatimonadota bacterium]
MSLSSGWTQAGVASADIVQTDGVRTLRLTRVQLVVRSLELKRRYQSGCAASGGAPGACRAYVVGPLLLDLPLDRESSSLLALDVPPGVYDEVDFDLHKPDDDSPQDIAFLAEHPAFRGVSVRAEGEFEGTWFVFVQDLNGRQEADLVPPLQIQTDAPETVVTLRVDARRWFWDGPTLLDPRSGLKGHPNERIIEDNIEASIEAFEDRDRDGAPDA